VLGRLSEGQWTHQTKSVIAGTQTHFARQLPESLRIDGMHRVPDPTHSNLRFWFTPDAFEQDNTPDDTPVALWRNVAQLGIDAAGVQTLYAEPVQVERLRQPLAEKQPRYKKNVVNGRGAVHFSRAASDGSNGQFMQMYKNSTLDQTGFFSTASNPFESKGGGADKAFTILLVARTQQAVGDTGEMGILRYLILKSSIR
jgi:hypothetical protein